MDKILSVREARPVVCRHCKLLPELLPVKNIPVKRGNVKFGELYTAALGKGVSVDSDE